mmetsp:Transcript_21171/g.59107  ORF Transcript_21171/g.59107 Transcript_21171/m.59107 type:complete len:249 (+) Transcript_21171:834-1580(+)
MRAVEARDASRMQQCVKTKNVEARNSLHALCIRRPTCIHEPRFELLDRLRVLVITSLVEEVQRLHGERHTNGVVLRLGDEAPATRPAVARHVLEARGDEEAVAAPGRGHNPGIGAGNAGQNLQRGAGAAAAVRQLVCPGQEAGPLERCLDHADELLPSVVGPPHAEPPDTEVNDEAGDQNKSDDGNGGVLDPHLFRRLICQKLMPRFPAKCPIPACRKAECHHHSTAGQPMCAKAVGDGSFRTEQGRA